MSKYVIEVESDYLIPALKTELARLYCDTRLFSIHDGNVLKRIYDMLDKAIQYHEPEKLGTDQEALALLRSINQAVQRIAR